MNATPRLRRSRQTVAAATALLLMLALGPPAAEAVERRPAVLAEVQFGLQEIRFQPVVLGKRWEVVLSGPSEIWLRWEIAGGAPSISLADIQERAGHVPDGLYSWELIRSGGSGAHGDGAAAQQVQAGYFSVSGGSIARPGDRAESEPVPNLTHNEDVYIVGRLCVGLFCDDTEGFGFEDIRIQEENIEILFEDTSTTTGFPTRDWRIKANDTFNGGASYFAIIDKSDDGTGTTVPFRIEAGAPGNTVYLEDDGDVGIGTSNPATKLHVIGDASIEGAVAIDGDLSVLSSRDAKRDLVPARGEEVLARLDELPIFTWRHRGDPRDALHMGPTAEDFSGAFGLGADDRHLSPTDAAGVALAAVRELSQRLRDQQEELAALREQNRELAGKVERLRGPSEGPQTLETFDGSALIH